MGVLQPLDSFFGIDPNIRTPYVQNWNLNIQQAITNKLMLQVAYVGSKGTRLFRFRDINQPSQAQITAFDSGPQCVGYTFPNCPIAGFDGPDGVNFNVPRTAFPNFFYVNQEESTANSIYHALQASLHIDFVARTLVSGQLRLVAFHRQCQRPGRLHS